MKSLSLLKPILYFNFIAGLFTGSVLAQEETAAKKDEKPLLRILCVEALPDAKEVMLATKDEEGEWNILSKEIEIRSKFVTQWIAVEKKALYLVKKTNEATVSLGQFSYPKNAKRVILVLVPNVAKKNYHMDVINPAGLTFSKGKTLIANYSKQRAVVQLGSKRKNVELGKKVIMTAGPDDNGMFRMLLGYLNEKGQPVPCYDRYVGYNKESRDFLLLFPDTRQPGFAVFSLAEFGPFE